MAIEDRVQPLKLEDPTTGGENLDFFPTAMDRNEDYVDCRGVAVQDGYSNDTNVRIERSESTGNLVFVDAFNSIPVTLTRLLHANDGYAVHKNVASEISTISEKVGPIGTDLILIEDSSTGYTKRKVQISNLPSCGGSGMPIPISGGQVLYALSASQFTAETPLTSRQGWLLNNSGILLVVG